MHSFHKRLVLGQYVIKKGNFSQNSYLQVLASASTSNPFQKQRHALLEDIQPSVNIPGIQSPGYGWKGNNKSDLEKKPEEIAATNKKLLKAKPRISQPLAR